MAKIVPQKNSFDLAAKLDHWKEICTYATAVFSFLTGIFQGLTLPKNWISTLLLPVLTLIATVMTLVMRTLFDSEYRRAEAIRRDAFIDNAFGCLIADMESEDYYSNDSLPSGTRKALLNIAENCFFSLPIVDYMFKRKLWIAIPLGAALITVMVFNIGGSQFVILAFNLILSLTIIDDVQRLYHLRRKLENVHEKCKEALSHTMISNPDCDDNDNIQFVGKTIREIVRYETALSYASVMLDSRYFEKINTKRLQEWKEYKKRYGVE